MGRNRADTNVNADIQNVSTLAKYPLEDQDPYKIQRLNY